MKRSVFILMLILSLLLCACGKTEAPEVTDNTWHLGSATLAELGAPTELLYVSDEYVEFFGEGADAPRIRCTMSAKNGILTLEDHTNGKTYTGTYSDEEEFSPDATYYKITLGQKRGRALSQRLADKDGNEIYTLSVSVGDYELFFLK